MASASKGNTDLIMYFEVEFGHERMPLKAVKRLQSA